VSSLRGGALETTGAAETSEDASGPAEQDLLRAPRIGLRWLYEVEQPEGALLQHHGVSLAAPEANRRLSFVPAGFGGGVVAAVDVALIGWKQLRKYKVATNPLEPGELADLSAMLNALGAEVVRTWNGHPGTTGSLALHQPAHPSLRAAVDRYRAGCPDHPAKHVFCECGWYQAGRRLLIEPEPAAA
jgi:hypothetical protein